MELSWSSDDEIAFSDGFQHLLPVGDPRLQHRQHLSGGPRATRHDRIR